MMDHLSQPIVFTLGKETKCIGKHGGVAGNILDKAIDRMRCWVVLAKATLSAEFPNFEFCNALSAFNLTKDLKPANIREQLDRIAQPIGLDLEQFFSEFTDIQPRAFRIHKAEQLDNKDAWREAVSRITKTAIGRSTHPTDTLRTALIFYFAYGASTSGVEQSFSKGSWAYTNRQLKLNNSEKNTVALTD